MWTSGIQLYYLKNPLKNSLLLNKKWDFQVGFQKWGFVENYGHKIIPFFFLAMLFTYFYLEKPKFAVVSWCWW